MKRILKHVGGKDFRRTYQRKLDEQRALYLERREKEIQEQKYLEEIETLSQPYKSNWRSTLTESEWSAISGSGPTNSTAQTFGYYDSGILQTNLETGQPITFTASGLGGVEGVSDTTIIDYGFGDTQSVSAPTYNQLALAGYAKPLGGVQRQTQQTENERIDAEIRKLEEQIRQLIQQQNDLGEEYLATEPQYTGMTYAEYVEKNNELGQKWGDKMWPLQKKLKYECGPDQCKGIAATLVKMSEQMIKEHEDLYNQYKNQTDAFAKAQDTHRAAYEKKDLALETQKDALKVKIAELEKQRPINQQLDASQQAYPNLPLMNARVGSAVGTNLVAQVPPDISPYLDSDGKPNLDALGNADAETFGKVFNYLKNKTPKTPTVLPDIIPEPEYDPNNYPMRFPFPRGNQNMPSFDTSKLEKNYGEIASTELKSLRNVVTLPQKTLNTVVDTVITGIEKTLGKKAESAINVLNYHKEWQKNPTPQPQNVTSLLSKGDYNYLNNLVKTVVATQPSGATDGILSDAITNAFVNHQLRDAEADRPGLRNLFGNLDSARKESGPSGDGAYVVTDERGNQYVEFRKAYDFDNITDFAGVGNPLMAIGAIPYGAKKLGPYASFFGTDTMNIVVRVPINKKKTQNESTTWDRTKKHLKGA